MMFLKTVVVLICFSGGALFLAAELGAPIPFVRYKGLEAIDLPAGIALLAAGILLAIFWKIKKTMITEVVEVRSDGGMNIKKTTVNYELYNKPDPRDPPGPREA